MEVIWWGFPARLRARANNLLDKGGASHMARSVRGVHSCLAHVAAGH